MEIEIMTWRSPSVNLFSINIEETKLVHAGDLCCGQVFYFPEEPGKYYLSVGIVSPKEIDAIVLTVDDEDDDPPMRREKMSYYSLVVKVPSKLIIG